MIGIGGNIPTFGANALWHARNEINTAIERLATGKQINAASDNPAGTVALAPIKDDIATALARLEGYEQSGYRLAAREGALSGMSDLLVELDGLVVQSANTAGLGEGELQALQTQIDGIIGGIDFAATSSRFKGELIADEYTSARLGAVTRTVTGEDGEVTQETYTLADLRGSGAASLIEGDPALAAEIVKNAGDTLASERARVGTQMRELDRLAEAEYSKYIELEKMRSSIEDADYAKEVARANRGQILEQAAIFAQKTAQEQQAQTVLSLLDAASNSSAAPGRVLQAVG